MKTLSILTSIFLIVVLSGCQGGESDLGTTPEAPVSIEDQIKKIESNPNVPRQAKDAQINALKARQTQAQAQSDAMKKK